MLRTFFARGRKAEEEEENLSLRLSVVLLLVAPPPLIKLQLYNLKRYTQREETGEGEMHHAVASRFHPKSRDGITDDNVIRLG